MKMTTISARMIAVVLVSVYQFLSFQAVAAEPLAIHGALVVGAKTNRPFLYLIPTSGNPVLFSAADLPPGIALDSKTGILSGTATVDGRYTVTLSATDGKVSVDQKIVLVVSTQAVALTPVMGWNPWYVWGCNIDDKKIRQAADLMVSSGLAAHGYNYVNLDDCWAGARNAAGEMVPNSRFPDMKALADYVHARGLRIGIYTSPGTKTCANYPGSVGHVEQDVQTYAKWGIDLIKYDWCGYNQNEQATYRQMSDLIERAPRSMVHMMCQYGVGDVWTWGTAAGGNMWRTNNDLADAWESVLRNGFKNVAISPFASAGHWNDLDMLMVGKGNWPDRLGQYDIPNQPPHATHLTFDEQVTHLSLWSLLASPLIFSGDMAQIDAKTLQLATNDEVLAVDQDPAALPVRKISDKNGAQVLARNLSDGSIVIGLFNLNSTGQVVVANFKDLGIPAGRHVKIRNLWSHMEMETDLAAVSGGIPAHGVFLLKLTVQ